MEDLLKNQHDRLKAARVAAGYRTAKAFYIKHDFKKSTYLAHESGRNPLTLKAAKKYSELLKVKAGWLLTGNESSFETTEQYNSTPQAKQSDLIFGNQEISQYRLEFLQNIHGPASINFIKNSGLKAGMTVIDAGCGAGTMSHWLSDYVGVTGQIIGLDNNPTLIEMAITRARMANKTNLTYKVFDLNNIKQYYKNTDFIYCRFTLCLLENRDAILKSLVEALRPGGIIVIEDANHSNFFHYPKNDAFNKALDIHLQLGEKMNCDFDYGDKLFSIMSSLELNNFRVEFSQPAVIHTSQKRMLEYLTAEYADKYIEHQLITENEIHPLIEELAKLAEMQNGLMGYTKVTQVRAIKTH